VPEATLPACDTQIRLAPSRSSAWPLSACSRNWQLLQTCWPEAPSMDISHPQTRNPSQCCCAALAADPDLVSSRCSPPPLHPGTGFATTHSPPPAEFYALMLCTTQRHPKSTPSPPQKITAHGNPTRVSGRAPTTTNSNDSQPRRPPAWHPSAGCVWCVLPGTPRRIGLSIPLVVRIPFVPPLISAAARRSIYC